MIKTTPCEDYRPYQRTTFIGWPKPLFRFLAEKGFRVLGMIGDDDKEYRTLVQVAGVILCIKTKEFCCEVDISQEIPSFGQENFYTEPDCIYPSERESAVDCFKTYAYKAVEEHHAKQVDSIRDFLIQWAAYY